MFVKPIVLPDWATLDVNGRVPTNYLDRADSELAGSALMARRAIPSWRFLVSECRKASVTLTYTGVYRTLAQQQALWIERGGVGVAKPGHSMHGWGLAIDIAENGYGDNAESIGGQALDVVSWIIAGWELPFSWEGDMTSRAFEPWHLNVIR